MPNRWESSTRPLSVKTVYVNGSRHAILSPEDPLLRSGIISFKKQSRPNSSMSILSISSSESQDSISVARIRSSKSETVRGGHGKDIPSMLQGCFVKLRLASSTRQKVKKGDVSPANSQEVMKTGYPEINHCKAKNCQSYEEFSKENKLAEARVKSNNCCYVYDFENDNKRKKNYCFVKITSGKPHQFIHDCGCGKNWGETQDLCDSKDCDENNYVISATIHNLIMGADKNENQSHDLLPTGDTDSPEGPWNNSLERNFYNPLPERVLQWIDLTSKQKNREDVSKKRGEGVATSCNVERISAGRTFIDECNKSRYCEKAGNKTENKTAGRKVMHREMSEEDVETEVKAEGNIETVLSMQTSDGNWNCLKESSPVLRAKSEKLATRKESNFNHLLEDGQPDEKYEVNGIPTKIDPNSLMAALLKNSIVNRLNFSMSSVDVQELLEKRDPRFSYQSKKKALKEKREGAIKRSKSSEAAGEDGNEDEKFKITGVKFWGRNAKKSCSENFNETTACQCMKNPRESGKTIKNRNLNEEFEKYQKAINNRNITRSGSVSQNLYPQQHGKASWPRDRRSVWLPEKDTNRPQLHIFIPPLPLKDSPDEALSEYFHDLRNLIPSQVHSRAQIILQQSIGRGCRNNPGRSGGRENRCITTYARAN